MRPDKHSCKNPSEWRFPPGKPPERLPAYYQIACDFGTSLMLAFNDSRRNQPIYLCGTHAAEMGHSTEASAGGNKSPESVPGKNSSKGSEANFDSVLDGRQGRRRLYILLLVAGLVLAGVLLGLGLFRANSLRPQKAAVVAEARKGNGNKLLPVKKPQKAQPAAPPQKRSQAIPSGKAQPHKPSIQTANIASGGTVARRVLPDVPKSASDTIRGTILVSVKVRVDASGNVARTELVVPGPSRYFARLSVESARRWKFNPPVADGKASRSDWVIRFYFTREATKAVASSEAVRAGKPRK